MPITIDTSIEINAPSSAVYDVLQDFKAYGEWNPFVRKISGDLKPGSPLEVHLLLPGTSSPSVMRPTMIEHTPGSAFVWRGQLLTGWLFRGEHAFRAQPVAGEPGRTVFVHGEVFTGLLAPLIMWLIRGQTTDGFRAMNRALKERCEAAGAAGAGAAATPVAAGGQ